MRTEQVAWAAAVHACGGRDQNAARIDEVLPRLTRLFDEERNPRLLALQAAARERGTPLLWDDETVSLGYGRSLQSWLPSALPRPEEVDWASVGSLPLALVTGTNGKSTTVRMRTIVNAAAPGGPWDFIRVGDRVIDHGDYSGAGGARLLLRQPDLEMAVLEVARGGLLRRGLGVERADVALITNVAADHLGEYGIHSVAELIEAKFIVRKALAAGGRLLLNADDEGVVAYAGTLQGGLAPVIDWFSLDADSPQLRQALQAGGRACYLEDGWLVAAEGARSRRRAARGNSGTGRPFASVANALGDGHRAGSIRAGLAAFRGDRRDNQARQLV
jgi:hypothetical protein